MAVQETQKLVRPANSGLMTLPACSGNRPQGLIPVKLTCTVVFCTGELAHLTTNIRYFWPLVRLENHQTHTELPGTHLNKIVRGTSRSGLR